MKKKEKNKRKRVNKVYSETSSENSGSMSIADTDHSEYGTCVEEMEDKENLELEELEELTIPFGSSDIRYFTSDIDLKEGD